MKSKYIADLKPGDTLVNEPFLMQDTAYRQSKDGRTYLLYTVSDKTGQANGIYWDTPDDVGEWLRSGAVVLITGRVNNYREALQISATDMTQHLRPDMTEFLAASRRPREEMVAELKGEIGKLGQPWQALVGRILLDETFLVRFANAPAARKMHHAYIGGLLEHTLSMAAVAHKLADHYPYVNRDLLLAGALLHDVGKPIEYQVETAFDYSDDGRLVGHIVRGIVMVEQAAAELGDFPQEELRLLVHLIAAHHGTLEWGSPTAPKTLEAILLHQIDLLDSRVQGFYDHWRTEGGDNLWTAKSSPILGTELRRPPGLER